MVFCKYQRMRAKGASWDGTSLKELGTQTLGTYIYKWQITVSYWVELRPILEVCDGHMVYEGEGRRRDPWWKKTAARKHLSATIEDILEAARERRQESRSHGEGRGGEEVSESDSGSEVYWCARTDTGDVWVVE